MTNNSNSAKETKRNKANLFDILLFVIVIVIVSGQESLAGGIKLVIILGYPLLLNPILMMLGGTLGQRSIGLRIRKMNDTSKLISLGSAYKRILFAFIYYFKSSKDGQELTYETQTNTLLFDPENDLSEEEVEAQHKQKARFNFIVVSILYLAWVIWLGNYWFLLGLPIIFDIYISNKVNWTPWKKREGLNHWFIEWLDALIFAIVAVTIINIFLFQNYKIPTGSMEKSLLIGDHLYVSKVAYGPRIPHTPLSIPFMQHTIPGTTSKSYAEWIKLPYKRLAGFGKIKRDEPVVFNFPAGDTVIKEPEYQSLSYYSWVRNEAERIKELDVYTKKPLKTDKEYYNLGRQKIWDEHDILVRPVDRRDNYIKRCVGIPGDTLEIIKGTVYRNSIKQEDISGLQYMYAVFTGGRRLNERRLRDMGIYKKELNYTPGFQYLQVPLTGKMVEEIEKNRLVQKIEPLFAAPDSYDPKMFPHNKNFQWNLDNYGPIYIPKKGATIEINLQNLPLYERIIGHYEENTLEIKDSLIYINNEPVNSYTFKMNYYWMMGDNRHSSLDSRYWGYVPEDHIVGKPKFVWLSLNTEKSFPANIRLKRMFMAIK